MKLDRLLAVSKVVSLFLIAVALFINGWVTWLAVKTKQNEITATAFLNTPELKAPAMRLLLAGFSLEEVLEYYYSEPYVFNNKPSKPN